MVKKGFKLEAKHGIYATALILGLVLAYLLVRCPTADACAASISGGGGPLSGGSSGGTPGSNTFCSGIRDYSIECGCPCPATPTPYPSPTYYDRTSPTPYPSPSIYPSPSYYPTYPSPSPDCSRTTESCLDFAKYYPTYYAQVQSQCVASGGSFSCNAYGISCLGARTTVDCSSSAILALQSYCSTIFPCGFNFYCSATGFWCSQPV